MQISGLALIFAACVSNLSTDVFLRDSQCNETNSLIGALVILRELSESHLSLATDWYAQIILSDRFYLMQ